MGKTWRVFEMSGMISKTVADLPEPGEVEMPSSIRTPGRTWTRYSRFEDLLRAGENREISPVPEIQVEGDAQVYTGDEAVEEADERLFGLIEASEDRMNAVHATRMNSIVYIRVEGNASVEIDYNEEGPLFTHLVVDTSRGAELDLSEKFRGEGKIQTSFTELYLGENSTVNFGVLESFDADLSYSRRKAVLERDAGIKWLNSQFSGELNRTRIETVLKGDNSSTEKTGVWYPKRQQHFDLGLEVYHRGENTRCNMDSRAVVDDSARSVYEGLQQVGRNANETKSFQDQKTLMLSDDAEDDASPKLMIENPGVEASHAASTGTVPSDELHYLESRGLTEDRARRLVVRGYFEPVMESITLPGMKELIREEVEKKLSG